MKRNHDTPKSKSMKIKPKEEKPESLQRSLLDVDTVWEKEWQNMPEYAHQDLEPIRTILIHFQKEEDVKAFEKLIDQKFGAATKYVWFPKVERTHPSHYRYVDDKE